MYKKTKFLVFIISLSIFIITMGLSFAEENTTSDRKSDIYNEYQKLLKVFSNTKEIFVDQPKFSPPNFPGKLTDELLETGIATTNFIRFVAGLSSNVILDDDWNISSQHAALISAVNEKISHSPEKPNLMSDAVYNIAKDGASKSNLYYAYGYSYDKYSYKAIYDPIISFMNDSDSSNIKQLGHRRWILNPHMKKIGLGYVKNNVSNHFAAMKVFDNSENLGSAKTYDYISWPSKLAFPIEFFSNDQAWSVSLNPEIYDSTKISSVNVRLKDLSSGKTWVFDRDLSDKNLLYIDKSNLALPFCIIFKPNDIKYKDDSFYEITVNGLYTNSGQQKSLNFKTEFFSLKNYKSDSGKNIEIEPSSWAARDINILKTSKTIRNEAFENFHSNITRKDFIYLAVKVYETLSDSKINVNSNITFSDTDDIYALKAATVGITNGIGAGKFGPNMEITREQLATFMAKAIKLSGKNLKASTTYSFSDDDIISSWAKESVYLVKNNNIVNGIGNDKFDPKGKATVEQSLIITKKILDLK